MDELRRSLRMMKEDFDLVGTSPTTASSLRAPPARRPLRRAGAERAGGTESALALFRVLQEAITNVARHCGKGTAVEVTLGFEPAWPRCASRIARSGFVLPRDRPDWRGGALRLANMQERARKVSGDLRMRSLRTGYVRRAGGFSRRELER